MKLDITSKYILGIVGIVALVGIVVMILNSAGFSEDISGDVTAVAKTTASTTKAAAATAKTTDAKATVSTAKQLSTPLEILLGESMAKIEYSLVGEDRIDMVIEYSIPEEYLEGLAGKNIGTYMIDMSFSIDAAMQDFNNLMNSIMASGRHAAAWGGDASGNSWITWQYDVDGSETSGDQWTETQDLYGTVTSREQTADRDSDNDGARNQDDEDADGDGQNNDIDSDDDDDNVNDEDDDYPLDSSRSDDGEDDGEGEEDDSGDDSEDTDSIVTESEGPMILDALLESIINTLETNPESLVNMKASTKTTIMTSLQSNINSNFNTALTQGNIQSGYITNIRVTDVRTS